MEKVKIKVSGCSRIRTHADAWCRISGYLSSMAALGCNSLAAIKIAFAVNAAHMIKMYGDNLDRSNRGMSSYDESRLSENGMKQAFGTIQLFRSHGVALSAPSGPTDSKKEQNVNESKLSGFGITSDRSSTRMASLRSRFHFLRSTILMGS